VVFPSEAHVPDPSPTSPLDQPHPETAGYCEQGLTQSLGATGQTPARALAWRFGDYELHEEIARGGMGVVFRARQVSLNRWVALKMILAGNLANEAAVQRFRLEAEAAGGLDHPHIVPIYEVGAHDGQHYFSMKLIEGMSLANWPKQQADYGRYALGEGSPPLPASIPVAVRLVEKVCRAVHHAHQRGILHRDLKPANILLDVQGEPHVTDFGLARVLGRETHGNDGGAAGVNASPSTLTQTGALIGTPSYMSPEQVRGEKRLTVAADIYGLGAVLYELITGQPPFRGATVAETLNTVLSKPAPRPSACNAAVDRELESICLRCLAKEAEKRYSSAEALANDLESWLTSRPIQAAPAGPVARALKWIRRRPERAAWGGCVAVLVVVMLLGTAVMLARLREERQRLEDTGADANRHANRLIVERAIQLCEHGDRAEGLLRLAHVLARTSPSDDEEIASLRRVLGGWIQAELPAAEFILAPQSIGVATVRPDIAALAISPDGRWLACATYPHRLANDRATPDLHIWDMRSSELVAQFGSGKAQIKAIAFAHDNKRIYATDESKTQLFDLSGQALLKEPIDSWGAVYCDSPDGKRVLCKPGVWDLTGARYVAFFPFQPGSARFAGFDRQRKRLFVVQLGLSWELFAFDTEKVWRDRDQAGRDRDKVPALEPVEKSVRLPDSFARMYPESYAFAVRTPQGITLHDLETRQQIGPTFKEVGKVQALSPDRRLLAVVTQSSIVARNWWEVQCWDAATGEPAGPPRFHAEEVTCMAFSADSNRLFTGARDGVVRSWPTPTTQRHAQRWEHGGRVICIDVARDGMTVATGGSDGKARLWSRVTGQPLGPPLAHTEPVVHVEFSPNGSRILTIAAENSPADGQLRKPARAYLWDAKTGQAVAEPRELANPLASVAFDPKGNLVPAARYNLDYRNRGGSDNRLEIAGDGTVRLYPRRSHAIGIPIVNPAQITDVAFTPGGEILATASADGAIYLWDAHTGWLLCPAFKHERRVNQIAVDTASRFLVTASDDGTARLWTIPAPLLDDVERIHWWLTVRAGRQVTASRRIEPLPNWRYDYQRGLGRFGVHAVR
jgi:WD40 repeat protein